MANVTIGATPTHTFTVDTDLRDAVEIWVTYAQNKKVILNKTLTEDNLTVTEDTVVVTLSQEDTLKFYPVNSVKIQIRARFGDGSAIKSDVINTTSDECLKRQVI